MTGSSQSTWFQRYLLPGFAFKAVVIGGGYATGRELAEFFLPSGPLGGLMGLTLAMLVWSAVCAVTFLFARRMAAYDYRSFFEALLGPFWIVFEIAYLLFVVLILAVFGAAAGAIGTALFEWPPIIGTLALALAIILFATFGNSAVERLFKYVSFLLYAVYALFMVLSLWKFGDRIAENFTSALPDGLGWAIDGLSYAGYNVVGAVVILPVIRHMTSERDAIASGLIAGPLAMIPAFIFFISMIAFYPGIASETLPSDFLLQQLHMPLLHVLFQIMIFSALLESGTGSVHAINERIAAAWRERRETDLSRQARAVIAAALLIACIFVADQFGLVKLIASGYRWLSYALLAVFVIPVLTIGLVRVLRHPHAPA